MGPTLRLGTASRLRRLKSQMAWSLLPSSVGDYLGLVIGDLGVLQELEVLCLEAASISSMLVC